MSKLFHAQPLPNVLRQRGSSPHTSSRLAPKPTTPGRNFASHGALPLRSCHK